MITDRIDAITQIPPERMRAILPAPKSVKVELSGRCNYRCGYCALRTRVSQPTKDMDAALFRRLAAEMREAGVEELGMFYIGESFMNGPLLADCISYAKRILEFPYVFLTTNGSLATYERVRACMEAGLDSLKFSINASTPEQFEQIMGVKASLFERTLDNLQDAWKVRQSGGYKCGLYASSILYDGEQQQRMEAMLKSHVVPWVDEHYWLPLYSMGSFATEREKELGYRPIAGNQGRIGALRSPLPCWSVFTEGHITHDGLLSACCFDADGKWVMADLKTTPFMEAWNSQPFVVLREAHLRGDVTGTVCEECVAYAS